MNIRMAAPDGSKSEDGQTIAVLAPGSVVGRGYRLHYLSCGGMSIAYRALGSDGLNYFAKEVNAANPRDVEALLQEKSLLERLDHPGIPKVKDGGEYEGFYYLILDFIEGGSLEQQLSPFEGIFVNEKIIRAWAVELCAIVGYLHAQNPPVIYRDLKPQNILKDKDGRLHLIDFGIASQGKNQSQFMGTALTASPEHYRGQTDERSDIFSLGATLYHLLSNGRSERDSPFEFPRLRKINGNVSERTEEIVMRCLALSPAERYPTVDAVLRALQGIEEPAKRALAPAPKSSGYRWLLLGALVSIGLASAFLLIPSLRGTPSAPIKASR